MTKEVALQRKTYFENRGGRQDKGEESVSSDQDLMLVALDSLFNLCLSFHPLSNEIISAPTTSVLSIKIHWALHINLDHGVCIW